MTDIDNLKVEQVDIDSIKRMHQEFKRTYEQRVGTLTSTYNTMMKDMQKDYDNQLRELDKLNQKVVANHNKTIQATQDEVRRVEDEKNEIQMERQKLNLEAKKLQNLQNKQKNGVANVTPRQEYTVPAQQYRAPASNGSSNNVMGKKKAADFYFTKKSTDQKPAVKNDFMMKDVSPVRTPPPQAAPAYATQSSSPSKQSVKMSGGFTYDTTQDTSASKPTQPVTTKRWSTKSKAADHYMKPASPTKNKSPIRGNRKSFTKSPSRSIQTYQKQEPPAAPQTPQNPDLPQQLVEEFKKSPTNYNKIDALLNSDHFDGTQKKWKELGVLFAEDIIKNSTIPVDYHLRVAENDLASGFGQVDKTGQLQGIGRECYDFLYEGQFKNNLYHGWGRYINHQGVYWGLFENGLRNGRGKWQANDGKSQDGNWVQGTFK